MSQAARRRSKLPERPPRYRFALTPLADAMFQLLIFFMLSSSLTPYSLITLRSGSEVAVEGEAGQETAEAQTPPPEDIQVVSGETVLWTIDHNAIIANGTVFDPEDLFALAEALGSEEAPADVVLIVRDEAQVQDVASVLEALQTANIASVQVTRSGEG